VCAGEEDGGAEAVVGVDLRGSGGHVVGGVCEKERFCRYQVLWALGFWS